jgi:prepilin peptidase CpaA
MDAALIIWMSLCAAQDARQRRISNLLTLGALALGCGYLLWHGTSPLGAALGETALAVAAALALSLPGYLLGRMGAGDVKLLLALAVLSTLHLVLLSVAGATLTMLLWLWTGPRLWPLLSPPVQRAMAYLAPEHRQRSPYAPFLLAGMLFSLACLY